MIRPRFVGILLRKELLRFRANPALWILLLIFLLIGILIGASDVILQRDTYNVVVQDGEPSGFLRFAADQEPNLRVWGPDEAASARGLTRVVLLRQDTGGPEGALAAGALPPLEISSPELSREDLGRLRDLLVKNAFVYLGVRAPLDIRIGTARAAAVLPGPEIALEPSRSAEDFKKLVMALLITISMNIVNFNLFTVSFTEEKQSRTLLAVLLTPARSSEAAAAKAVFFLIPGLSLPAAMAGFYRPDVLAHPVFWVTLAAGALLYLSMGLILVSFVEKQSSANLVCLGYLFFLSSLFILAPRFTALQPVKNLLPENFIFSILSFLFDGTPTASYAPFLRNFLIVSLAAPFVAMAVFTRRMGSPAPAGAPQERRWTLGDCALIFGFCLFFHFVISPGIFRLVRAVAPLPQDRMAGYLLLYLVVFALPLALILPVYTRVKFRAPLFRTFLKSDAPGGDLLAGALWFSLYLAAVLAAGWLLVSSCVPQVPREALGEFKTLAPHQVQFFHNVMRLLRNLGPGSVVLFLFVLGVVVPVLEEFFFRGCLLSALQHRWGPRAALVLSALVFGAAHMNPVLFPLYFLLGILTGRLAQKRGGLLAPVAFHSLNNLCALAVILLIF